MVVPALQPSPRPDLNFLSWSHATRAVKVTANLGSPLCPANAADAANQNTPMD